MLVNLIQYNLTFSSVPPMSSLSKISYIDFRKLCIDLVKIIEKLDLDNSKFRYIYHYHRFSITTIL